MELLYALLGALPFDWLQHGFMKNAFLAVLLVTPLFGLLSTMVVSNRMAFFSDSLGHGAFTGLAVGVLLGWLSPLLSLVAFSVVFALLITYIKNRSSASTDTIIGVFSSTGIALGLMLMSRGGGFNKYSSYLIGDLLSISPEEIGSLFFVFLAVVLVWALVFNSLLVLSINASFARSRGVAAFLTVSIQWVGLLIINSLLVLPAAAARNIAQDVKSYHLLSVAIALLSGVAGLLLAYYCNMAAGASIVVVAAAVFFLTLLLKPYFVR